jgi:TonB family protein
MLAVWFLGAAIAVGSQQAPAAQELSVGATAMLVGRSDPGYRAALQHAIVSADPAVRAVAARVAGVRRQGDMVDPLRRALETETDPVAKREQQQAIYRLERAPVVAPPDGASPPLAVRTFPLIAPGLLSSLIVASGCKPDKHESFGAARLTFDASGAVTRSEIDPSQLPRKCADVVGTMARLTIADERAPSGVHSEYLLLPLDAAFAACADTDLVTEDPPRPANASLTPPRKTRDVKPQYPAGALRGRTQGTVFISAHVTRAGCINDARVTRGVDPELDFAALVAVVQWQFDPARVNGVAVPFVLTSTVSFKVR